MSLITMIRLYAFYRSAVFSTLKVNLYQKSVFTLAANTTHLPYVQPMLAHRLRRRPNIGETLGRSVVFAG